jgi:alcohol dehydrogenase class IV
MIVDESLVVREMEEILDRVRSAGLRLPASVVFAGGAFSCLGRYVASATASGPILVVGGRFVRDRQCRLSLEEQFCRHDVPSIHYVEVRGEPTCESVQAAVTLARRVRPHTVVGIGGGSSLDTAKAVAALLTNSGTIEEYLEGGERTRQLECAPAPQFAIPTTGGTGSEMTRNAVIGIPARKLKRSLRDDRLLPTMALVDPDLTLSAPANVTLASGLDALTQLIEVCISKFARPETTEACLKALRHVRWALPRAIMEPTNRPARSAMTMAASVSGLGLTNAGLGMAHGIASALGAVRPLPHGWICGVLLPHVLRVNRDAAEQPLARVLAAFLGEEEPKPGVVDRGLEELDRWYAALEVPADLSSLGLTDAEIEEIAVGSMGNSMRGNPVVMTPREVARFLRRLCGKAP